jgi:large subunit ribosomal protein L23
MALFSKKPKEETKKATTVSTVSPKKSVKAKKTSDARIQHVLVAPWFSEKALIGTEKGIYVFSVPENATKAEVKDAVEKFYKVRPRKVTLLHLPGKVKSLRTRRGTGTRARRHKAYVYLKKGETITFA